MKSIKLILPVILMLIITACSSVRVSSDFDRRADFRRYRTFNFTKAVDRINNLSELNRDRLKDDIAEQMEARGYRLADAPDILVNVFVKGRTKTTATATNFGGPWGPWGGPWGYYRGWGWGSSSTYVDVNRYVEGTMFVDVIDVQQKKMIWEGIAQGLINPRTQTNPKELERVVDRVFKDFPR